MEDYQFELKPNEKAWLTFDIPDARIDIDILIAGTHDDTIESRMQHRIAFVNPGRFYGMEIQRNPTDKPIVYDIRAAHKKSDKGEDPWYPWGRFRQERQKPDLIRMSVTGEVIGAGISGLQTIVGNIYIEIT